jgi:hypothetical protein
MITFKKSTSWRFLIREKRKQRDVKEEVALSILERKTGQKRVESDGDFENLALLIDKINQKDKQH